MTWQADGVQYTFSGRMQVATSGRAQMTALRCTCRAVSPGTTSITCARAAKSASALPACPCASRFPSAALFAAALRTAFSPPPVLPSRAGADALHGDAVVFFPRTLGEACRRRRRCSLLPHRRADCG